jgi:TonB family protein
MLTTPAPMPGPSFKQRYQESLKKARIEGSISNRGRAGVDAIATPLGRYQAQMKAALGSRWSYYVNDRMSLITPGSARISFAIDAQGRVHDVKLETNTGNKTYADLCEQAVRETKLPPLPPDIVATLPDERLETSFTFTFYTF